MIYVDEASNARIKRQYSFEEFIPKLRFDFKNYYSKTQKWIGHIIEIKEDTFVAQLEDITNGGTHEIGEFDKVDVSDADTELMELGAVFYWSVGKEIRNGQVINQSFIRFQRLPDWSEEEYDKAIDSADDLLRDLKWD